MNLALSTEEHELELEGLNLLEAERLDSAPTAQERERLSGERQQLKPPKSRGVGRDEEP